MDHTVLMTYKSLLVFLSHVFLFLELKNIQGK
ncbi:hypothetical protein BSNT_10708 [Bacillus subtilis subsp. natto BEST195]|nr:hypothetical protein BSNT_10708 [Bacillus subtilis subsp. natto BEST195]